MKKRNALLLLIGIAIGAALIWWFGRQPARRAAAAEVKIEDGQTIDFSSGKPVVTASTSDKAIMDAALKEMEDAAKNVRFAPLAASPGAHKKSGEAPKASPP